jgi:tRNA G10  N-methylase Trm11
MRKANCQYFFILGTNHTLSKVDIVNLLAKRGVEFAVLAASEEILLIETAEELAVDSLMPELGSAAKVGEIFKAYPLSDFPEIFLAEINREEFKGFFLLQEETHFGLSVYGAGGKFKALNQVFFQAPGLAREIKEKLEQDGLKANYLAVKERELSSVTVDQRGLLKNGFELVLGVGEEAVYIGKTLAVQDYESYSLRDYGRPARDPKSGMIPPKLARMMINLALKDKEKVFLDPFCGSGTMLQEMVVLGYQNIVGTDSSKKSIEDSQTNLNWLFGRFGLSKKDFQIKLSAIDVKKLSSVVPFKTVSAIVTEPYLGSPRARSFSIEQIKQEVKKLEELYLAAFSEFRKVLKDDGVIVIIFPLFRFKNQFFPLEILDQVKDLGFERRDFIPQKPEGGEKLNLNLTSRGSIVYFRPGQSVSREIFVFVKQS